MVRKSRAGGQENGLLMAAASKPSAPWIAPKIRAQSSTERAIGPSLSMLHDSVMQPCRLTRPKVGRRPVTPQRVQGDTMLPRVSLPMAKPTSPADVDDA